MNLHVFTFTTTSNIFPEDECSYFPSIVFYTDKLLLAQDKISTQTAITEITDDVAHNKIDVDQIKTNVDHISTKVDQININADAEALKLTASINAALHNAKGIIIIYYYYY